LTYLYNGDLSASIEKRSRHIMADDPLTETPAWLRILAERRGLTRALALVPALSRPALLRAGQPLPAPPTGATTEPAGIVAPETNRSET
jgi:hypothetical protein